MPEATPSPAHAYLHGFASGPLALKGARLAEVYADAGLELQRPDLNRPSFAELTYGAALAELDAMHERAGRPQWRIIASSMGGCLAALWSALHPDRVERAILLCPAFDLPGRWVTLMGSAFDAWRERGSMSFADGAGVMTDVHFGLVEDARSYPATPVIACPIEIVHGTEDAVVPIDSSREYARTHAHVALHEVADAHPLHDSMPTIAARATEFLIRPPPTTVLYWDHFGPQAAPTSEHFTRHLDEFLARESFAGCRTGVCSEQPGHAASFCVTPRAQVDAIAQALAPRRRR